MTHSDTPQPQPPPPPPRPSRTRTIIGTVAGGALLALAITVVWKRLGTTPEILHSLQSPDPLLLACFFALPIANLLCTSGSLWAATRRFGHIGFIEMNAVIGSASLINYLPMRAGLVGRLAYHKRVNNIAITRAGAASIIQLFFGMLGLALALGASLLPHHYITPVLVSFGVALGLASIGWTRIVCRDTSLTLSLGTSLGLTAVWRTLDMLVWVVRYFLALTLIGANPSWLGAIALAAVSQVGMLLSLVGNGLGIREWLVGLTARGLSSQGSLVNPSPTAPTQLPTARPTDAGQLGTPPPTTAPTPTPTTDALAIGLLADLLNRAAELVLIIPVGIACSMWIAKRLRNHEHAGCQTKEGERK